VLQAGEWYCCSRHTQTIESIWSGLALSLEGRGHRTWERFGHTYRDLACRCADVWRTAGGARLQLLANCVHRHPSERHEPLRCGRAS